MNRGRAGLLAVVLTLVLAACGGGGAGDGGTAQLWVTRDGGTDAVLTATVPAGLTVLQALDRAADVTTRYGGRYVQAIDGIEGSLARQQDWFYFLNGIEPDVGAAEVRLHPGDVAWWDFRAWAGLRQHQPVVVGAFPEPFRNGWPGERRPVEVRFPPALADAGSALQGLLGRGGTGAPHVFELVVEPGVTGAVLTATRGSANGSPVTFRLAGSVEAVGVAARALAADPSLVQQRYTARFDPHGRLLP